MPLAETIKELVMLLVESLAGTNFHRYELSQMAKVKIVFLLELTFSQMVKQKNLAGLNFRE